MSLDAYVFIAYTEWVVLVKHFNLGFSQKMSEQLHLYIYNI